MSVRRRRRSCFEVCFKRIPSQTLNKCSGLSPFSKPYDLKQKNPTNKQANIKSLPINGIKVAAI